jgi:hypothetical protein
MNINLPLNIKTPHVFSVSVANSHLALYIVSFFLSFFIFFFRSFFLSFRGSVYAMENRGSNNERKKLQVGA